MPPALPALLLLTLLAAPAPALDDANEEREDEDPQPERAVHEVIVVTATRAPEPISDIPTTISVLTREELGASPAVALDEQLRRLPGFSLFRRSGSLQAHPTAQGVSLRGIGPSGTSRSLVLFDGQPFNDPFGGWVAWNRIPALALDRVEVAPGSASQLYGSASLAGTLQLLPRRPSGRVASVRAEAGGRGTRDLEAVAGDGTERWSWLLAGRRFDTDGFFALPAEARGAVDTPVAVDFRSLYGRVTHGGLFVGFNHFEEERDNGTRLQDNSTRLRAVEGGFSRGLWKGRLHWQRGTLESTFSRILADRSEEFLTAEQRFPSESVGASLLWRSPGGLQVGGDWRTVSWEDERQSLGGVFVQRRFEPREDLELLAGVRFDLWENRSTQTSLNPRLAALYRVTPGWLLRGSLYRGFRAPTLNELYRPFRVGNVETLANPELEEETLWGAELGVERLASAYRLRANTFLNRLDGPVGNVTIEVLPDLILRQRQNLGRLEARGIEADLWARLGERWEVEASALLLRARVEETGLRPPQVPDRRATLALVYRGPLRLRLEGRWIGRQYDDDLNELPLGGGLLLDASLRLPLSSRFELLLAGENLADRRLPVARTPVEELGSPRLLRVGLRWDG